MGAGFRIDANLLIIESIHAVFHGGVGHWLARSRAYAQAVGKNVANPNEEIVAELIRQDVSIQLCAQTMRSHGWADQNVLSAVKIAIGADPRIIDLQQHRCFYIRF